MGAELDSGDIDVAHRLFKSGMDHTPCIIVRFKSRSARDTYFFKKSELKNIRIKDLGFESSTLVNGQAHGKIFINESLSVFSKQLFKAARETCSKYGYEYCFVNSGTVYAKKNKLSNKIKIISYNDLDKLKIK